MYAIEFESRIIDGTVKIPIEYWNAVSEKVRVIILSEHNPDRDVVFSQSKLTSNPIKVEKIVLPSREEIHER